MGKFQIKDLGTKMAVNIFSAFKFFVEKNRPLQSTGVFRIADLVNTRKLAWKKQKFFDREILFF